MANIKVIGAASPKQVVSKIQAVMAEDADAKDTVITTFTESRCVTVTGEPQVYLEVACDNLENAKRVGKILNEALQIDVEVTTVAGFYPAKE